MEPNFIIAGLLRRQYILPPNGNPLLDVPGGSLLFAASSAALWQKSIGLVGVVGEDYPRAWLQEFNQRGYDTRGIHIMPMALDVRDFVAYDADNPLVPLRTNLVSHFVKRELSFPKALLGYQPAERDRNIPLPRVRDIPTAYLFTGAVHVCSMDMETQKRLIVAFAQGVSHVTTLDSSAEYMQFSNKESLRVLLDGVTAFTPSEEHIRAYFWGQTNDLWEMAEEIGKLGCEFVIIKRRGRGQLLYDTISKKRWEVPAYPVKVNDPTGAGDSFCGGFLVGYRQTYDPLQGVLCGNVSASLNIEGSGAFYVSDVLPGLAQARLQSLAEMVQKV